MRARLERSLLARLGVACERRDPSAQLIELDLRGTLLVQERLELGAETREALFELQERGAFSPERVELRQRVGGHGHQLLQRGAPLVDLLLTGQGLLDLRLRALDPALERGDTRRQRAAITAGDVERSYARGPARDALPPRTH